MMNLLDRTLIPLYNQFAHRSRYFDAFVANLSFNDLLKGGVAMAVFWGLWLARPAMRERRGAREALLATLVAAIVAVAIARALTYVLPFRARPLFTGGTFARSPYGIGRYLEDLPHWSSFPSDHAALFVALATGYLLVSRRVGTAMLVYVAVIILFPRLYLGIHYPTDVLVGAAIGAAAAVGAVIASRRLSPVKRVLTGTLAVIDRYPFISYIGLFLISYEMAALFGNLRGLAKVVIGHG